MFTNKDYSLINNCYFNILRQTENFIEIQSLNTKHCWIIKKQVCTSSYPIILYHKHTAATPYYHKHRGYNKISKAIEEIKKHDTYVLS